MQLAFDQPVTPRLLIEYYTDPLCPRSWAFEPHWRRLRAEFGHQFAWCYRLGGWLLDQPASQLACLAVKCAERQGKQAGHLYLRALREAALTQGCAIARPEELAAVADALAAQVPGLAKQLPAVFNATTFRQDLAAQAGAPALSEDVRQASLHHVQGVPTLVLRRAHQPDHAVTWSGQPYEVLLHELAQVAPDLFYVACLVEGGAG
jgi:predicted DsbA family dithiol-disulfide isomerase